MIAGRIKELREKKHMSQSKLADKLNVKQQTVGSWEIGRTEPSLDIQNKIADIFEVTLDYLNGRSSSKKTVDIDDDGVIMTFEGKPIPPEDLEIIRRVLRGGRSE